MNNKKVLRSTFIGFFLLLISLVLTGIAGMTDLINGGTGELYGHQFKYGFMNSINNYWLIWRPGLLHHEVAYIGQVLFFVAIVLTLALIVMSIAKKKPVYILPALFLGAAIAFLPFILILVVPMVQLGKMRTIAMALMSGITGIVLFAIYFEILATKDMLKESMALLNKAGGEEKQEEEPVAEEKKEEKEPEPVVAGLSEEEVRAIVEQYLKDHVKEKHVAGAVVAEEVMEEPEEEPEEEEEEEEVEEEAPVEAPADDNAPAGLAGAKGKRRKASFETRLRNSEFDIRHKYYDLRDYIKWYGLRNRISIPGDTFSYKRQRYVFVTIVGKHIRVYIGLNPKDYADSTIPVEAAEAKKYEDLPCLLRVKSDLSYRRAKKLVDDLMQKIGIEKPDEDEPKETQKEE